VLLVRTYHRKIYQKPKLLYIPSFNLYFHEEKKRKGEKRYCVLGFIHDFDEYDVLLSDSIGQ